jgi:hypothetical protein
MNAKVENFSTEKLIQLALTEFNPNRTDYVTTLHFRGDLEVLQTAQKLCHGEALVGLARRKDERVIEFLLKELTSSCVGYLVLEAAEEIGDFRLYTALVDLRKWLTNDRDLLESAIASCQKKPIV